jgi:hypothetical protein
MGIFWTGNHREVDTSHDTLHSFVASEAASGRRNERNWAKKRTKKLAKRKPEFWEWDAYLTYLPILDTNTGAGIVGRHGWKAWDGHGMDMEWTWTCGLTNEHVLDRIPKIWTVVIPRQVHTHTYTYTH